MRIVIPVYDQVDMLDVCGPCEMGEVPGRSCRRGSRARCASTPASCSRSWPACARPSRPTPLGAGRRTEIARTHYRRRRNQPISTSSNIRQRSRGGSARSVRARCCSPRRTLLDGFRVTTHWAFIPYLLAYHPDVLVADGHPRFVIDRDRITGGGISSGLDEALKLIELLGGREKAVSVQQTTQYYPGPPVTSAIPNVIATPMPPPTSRDRGAPT